MAARHEDFRPELSSTSLTAGAMGFRGNVSVTVKIAVDHCSEMKSYRMRCCLDFFFIFRHIIAVSEHLLLPGLISVSELMNR